MSDLNHEYYNEFVKRGEAMRQQDTKWHSGLLTPEEVQKREAEDLFKAERKKHIERQVFRMKSARDLYMSWATNQLLPDTAAGIEQRMVILQEMSIKTIDNFMNRMDQLLVEEGLTNDELVKYMVGRE